MLGPLCRVCIICGTRFPTHRRCKGKLCSKCRYKVIVDARMQRLKNDSIIRPR